MINFKKTLKRFKYAKTMDCEKCGETLKLSGRSDKSGIRHAHCMKCRLEWHLTIDGRTYSHPIR